MSYQRSRRIRRKKRRKKGSDSEHENTSPRVSVASDVTRIQRGELDRDAIMRLQSSLGNQAIQRLISYKGYKKSTKAPGKRSHIRPLDKAYKAYLQHEDIMTPAERVENLQKLIQLADTYLADPKRQRSKRRDGVSELKEDLVD